MNESTQNMSGADLNFFFSVAAPVFNEEENIESTVRYWFKCIEQMSFNAEVVLCNDGSTDSSAEILKQLNEEYPTLKVIDGKENHGYGYALSAAIQACSGSYIVTIDSDGQFDLGDITRLISMLKEGISGVTGYRTKKNDSFVRILADRALNLIVRTLFHTKLRDTNCALKIIERELLQSLRLESTGFSFPTEVCLRIQNANAILLEAPIQHGKRDAGKSKLDVFRTGWDMLHFLLYIRKQFILTRKKVIRQEAQ